MDRTLKITGFSLQRAIRQQLAGLFSTVAQVDKVYLSSDKNAAFVRLAFRSSLQFVQEQVWELGRERLSVRCAQPQPKDIQQTAKRSTVTDRTSFPNSSTTDYVVVTPLADGKFEDYSSGRSQFWADVPHHAFPFAPKRRKRKRTDVGAAVITTPANACRRSKRRRRKRKKAYLESFSSVPFGIEYSSRHGQKECDGAELPWTEGIQQDEKVEPFSASSEPPTREEQSQDNANGDDDGHCESRMTKAREDMDKPTEHQAVLNEVPLELDRPLGTMAFCAEYVGERCAEQFSELDTYNDHRSRRQPTPKVNHTSDQSGTKITKAVDMLDIFVHGPDLLTLSVKCPVSSVSLLEMIEQKTGTPKNLLHVTADGHCLTDDVAQCLQPGVSLQYTVKGKGGMHSGEIPGQGNLGISRTADENEVKAWLTKICKLTKDDLGHFEFMNGATLFEFKDHHHLRDVTHVGYGLARRVTFLRDHPETISAMMTWTTDDVISFIQQSLRSAVDLQTFREHDVNGVSLLAIDNVKEMEEHLGIKGMLAQRIIVEKNAFLSDEGSRVHLSQRQDVNKEGKDKGGGPFVPQERSPPEKAEKETSPKLDYGSKGPVKPVVSDSLDTDLPCVQLEKNDRFTKYKMFLQDHLLLQPLHEITMTSGGSRNLVDCDLKVIFHKRKNLNKLEETFLFLILCKPNFCSGKDKKVSNSKLWSKIVEQIPTLWHNMLPTDVQGYLTVHKGRIKFKGKIINFEEETTKIVSLPVYDDTVEGILRFPAKILIVDRMLLQNKCAGYSTELGSRSVSVKYWFGFTDAKYCTFDSENLELDFKYVQIFKNLRGNSIRCLFVEGEDDNHALLESGNKTVHSGRKTENTDNGCKIQSTEKCEEFAGVIPPDKHDIEQEQMGKHMLKEHQTEKKERLNIGGKTLNTEETSAGVNPFCLPRPFRQRIWAYEEGKLRIIETGDGMLTPAVELKYQCGCAPENDLAKRSFLYKGMEFVCGCLNARRNGTIYFGVAEGTVKDQQYEYGQIVGIEMNQNIQSQYYDLFRTFIKLCFAENQFEIVKRCVTGPHFVPIGNNSPCKCVIEIDVEPTSKQCEETAFTFDPKSIFEKYGMPEKKHIYTINQKDWTGFFLRDGSATMYIKPVKRKDFLKETCQKLIVKREEEEKTEDILNLQLISGPEAEKLKTFIGGIDMFPILVLPKLSEEEKARNIEYFRFLPFIHWSAVFDFDDRSDVDGVCSMSKSSKTEIDIRETVLPDFNDVPVDEMKETLSFPRKAAWIFANGKFGDEVFPRLDHDAWKDEYLTSIQTAVHAFYKSKEVIHPTRRRALILISDEVRDGIVELAMEFKTAFGWENIFFIFNSILGRDRLAQELQSPDKLSVRSILMPWKHAHNVICECLNVKGRNRDKFVCTAKGAHVPIPVTEWQSWDDLEVLSIKECLEEWDGLSLDQRKKKALDEELKFYKGQPVSWFNFFCSGRGYNHVMERTVMSTMINDITRKAQSHDRDTDRVPVVPLTYIPGAGGTTLGRNILWKLKEQYKCAVISKITENTALQVYRFWESEEELQEGHVIKRELKPVILFVDNMPADFSQHNSYRLSKTLFRKQLEYQLSKPIAILIHCRPHEDPRDGECQLKQTLTDAEKDWIEKKNEELETQKSEGIDVETLIAFLSLRHEFNKAKLQETVLRFINHKVLEKHERILIEYIALITSYTPASEGFQGLPVASCDDLMRIIHRKNALVQELPWQRTLTWIAKVLLVTEKAYEPTTFRYTYFVRIANQPYAKVILDTVLKQNRETVADIVMRCLKSELVTSRSPSRKIVYQTLTNMLIRRRVEDEETGEMSQLSPLLMEICESSRERAAEVLQEGFKSLGNEVFYQQLARLFMREKKFEEAKRYGQMAVELSPEKMEFKHTLGLVYLRMFVSVKDKTGFDEKDVTKKLDHLHLALDALKNFVETQGREEEDIIHNCFTYGQTITVINHVLEFLENILRKEELPKLGRYLTQAGYQYSLLDENEDIKNMLKSLVDRGVKALQFLLYVGYSYSATSMDDSMSQIFRVRRVVGYVRKTCLIRLRAFARLLKHIHEYSFGNTTEIREDNAFRIENIKLRGCFFESIFHHLQGGARKKRPEKGLEDLNTVKQNLEKIQEMTFTDMDNLMAVSLALELAEKGAPFSQNYSKVFKMCCHIIRARKETDELCFIRAHMYRVLVSWFNKDKPGFNVDEFRHSFQYRSSSLALPPRVHFFVAKSEPSLKLWHWTDIYEQDHDEEVKLTAVATRREVSQMLEIFTGMHKINTNKKGWQYSHIEMDFKYQNSSFPLTIPKIRGITVLVEAQVQFYLGFSLHGPVAYICRELSGDGRPDEPPADST